MGIYSGSVSLSRFKIIGKVPMDKAVSAILPFQGKPIAKLEKSTVAERSSWVMPPCHSESELVASRAWDLEDCGGPHGYFLRMRIEKKTIPGEVLQTYLQSRIEQAEAKNKKTLGREKRKEIREEVRAELMTKVLPSIRYVDGYWHTEQQVLYVFSTSKRAVDMFSELFHKTFCQGHKVSLLKMRQPIGALLMKGSKKAQTPVLNLLESSVPAS